MALPSINKTEIQNRFPTVYKATEHITNNIIFSKFSPYKGCNANHHNISMAWHLSADLLEDEEAGQADRIDGIFISIYSKYALEGFWIKPDNTYDKITVTDETTEFLPNLHLHTRNYKEIFNLCLFKDSDLTSPTHFNVGNVHHPEKIEAFYANNQDLLPESLQRRLFQTPPVPEPDEIGDDEVEEAPVDDHTYLYIGVCAATLLAVILIARKALSKPQDQFPQLPSNFN